MTRTRAADLDVHFDAVPGSVPAARHAAARWAATEGAQGPDLYRICLAVSEAVTNAVVHAYSQRVAGDPDGDGSDGHGPDPAGYHGGDRSNAADRDAGSGASGQIHLRGVADPDELAIFVGDEGCGIGRALASPGLGLGLSMIDESCESLTIRTRPGGGIELEMRFRLRPVSEVPRAGITSGSAAPPADAPAFVPGLSAGLRRRGPGRGSGTLPRRSINAQVHEDARDHHPHDEADESGEADRGDHRHHCDQQR